MSFKNYLNLKRVDRKKCRYGKNFKTLQNVQLTPNNKVDSAEGITLFANDFHIRLSWWPNVDFRLYWKHGLCIPSPICHIITCIQKDL